MGNAPSKPHGPGSHSPSSSPANPPANASTSGAGQAGAAAQQGRRDPRRRESLHATKLTPRPSPSLQSATATQPTGQSSKTATEALRQSSNSSVSSAKNMGNQESKPTGDRGVVIDRAAASSPLRPTTATSTDLDRTHSPMTSSIPLQDETLDSLPASEYNRPPRLPLPIGEEDYAPDSPIFSPQHLQDNVEPLPLDATVQIPRRSSVLSSTTADDDEDPGDELEYPADQAIQTVPTLLEWFEGGDKVYVTGTFANWDRKIKLRRDGPSRRRNVLSAMIHFPPGTHHIKFIVDNDMRTAKHLPTAVDFAGFLVNYIEVLPAPPPTGTTAPAATAPVDIPAAAGTRQDRRGTESKEEYRVPAGLHPPQVLPPTPELGAGPKGAGEAESAVDKPKDEKHPAAIVRGPPKRYHCEIPSFLLDLDAAEESSKLAKATAACAALPAPPSLPMFLAKSILNKEAPMRDDASVLVLPNHTVLNHLATSSIKNKVLATSSTTRYKKKFLTTIMYKPTSEKA